MSEQSNRSGNVITAIVIIVLVLAGLAGTWYFFMYKPAQEAEEKARQEQLAQAEAEQKAKEDAARKKTRYDQLIKDADAAFDQEDWQTAQSLYGEASSLFPDQQWPKDQLALVNAQLDEINAKSAKGVPGVVEKLTAPTGRYYVIVSSSVDEDLAMDYATKLANEGNSVKIIEPYASNKLFHRVSLADYDSREAAEGALGSYSAYGSGVWVLRF